MSSIIIKRSLGVAGLTGGLLLVGAGVALADDGPTDSFGLSQSSGEAEVSAPITLGGLNIGLSTESSTTSGSTTTTTTEDGSVTESAQDSTTTSSDLGLNVGEISVDPMAALSGATTSTDDSGAGEGSAAVSAPVQVGAIDLTGTTSTDSASAHESTVTDQDGSSVTEGSTSTDSSTTGGALGLDGLSLDPAAMLDGSAWTSDTGRDSAEAEGSADLTSPVNLGGLTAGITDERAGTDEAWTQRTDEDGDSTWTRTESEYASATEAGLTTGELTADPAAWLSGSTAGRGDDTAGESELAVAAPVTFGGAEGWFADQRASWDSVTTGTRTDDVTRESSTERADATSTGGTLGLGETALLPMLTGSTEGGTVSDDTTGLGMIDLAAPFGSEGAWLNGTTRSATEARDSDLITTDEGSTETSTWSSTSNTANPSLATGPVSGDLAGWAWGQLTGIDD